MASRVPLLSWHRSEDLSFWGSSSILSAFLIILAIWAGALFTKETLIKLIQTSDVVATPSQPTENKPEIEIELVPPPPEDHPEFIVPVEAPPPKPQEVQITDDPEPEPVVTETPPPPTPEVSPQPAVNAVPQSDPAPAAPSQSVAVTTPTPEPVSEPTPVPVPVQTPAETPAQIQLGNKNYPVPPYPPEARRRHIQGIVQVDIRVANGQITDVKVVSSGHPVLDASALEWIRSRWRFSEEPNELVRVPIRYELD